MIQSSTVSTLQRPEGASRTLAMVTLYGDLGGLASLFESLQKQTESIAGIVVVDNSPSPHQEHVEALASQSRFLLFYEHHPENLGISGALQIAFCLAAQQRFTHLWLFDQDSVPSFQAHAELKKVAGDPRVALACCLPLVQPDGAPLHGLEFRKFRFVRPQRAPLPSVDTPDESPYALEPYDCDATITSGTLVNLAALPWLALPWPALFIDGVDHAMCLEVRRAQFRVVVVPRAPMKHALGETRIVQSRFRKLWLRLPHYSALRLYYICRNHTWLELQASQGFWKFFCLLWRIKFLFWQCKMLSHEQGGFFQKSAACLRGTWDGMRGRLGKAGGL
ncbi:MAG: glycosyltransferase [Silvanigrellales bacterium]|jgi:rhamnosyltransferase|nr:glycosyltransferase [Silvanigrellales bacterium]